jgi:hypothetical protein
MSVVSDWSVLAKFGFATPMEYKDRAEKEE